MTEEEKEAIEQLKSWREFIIKNKDKVNKANDLEFYLRTVLKLTQKQQEEMEKKDKIINEMAKYIATLDTDEDICKNVINIGKSFCPEDDCDNLNREVDCDVCIKQYFESKV